MKQPMHSPTPPKVSRREKSLRTTQSQPKYTANVASPALEALGNMPRQPLFRPAQPLSYELSDHSKAYIEAEEYASGYSFLTALLTAGTSISTPAKPHFAQLPPPSQLSLASTLIVYPPITTKSTSSESIKGADAALRYLRSVQSTISPLDESIKNAFVFSNTRKKRRHEESPDLEHDNERLTISGANSQALWFRAGDFWHIVGWALNCSVIHKKRWMRWKLWLETMLDFLESEWDERVRKSKENDADAANILTEGIVWHFICENTTNRTDRRRIVRAILATATTDSRKDFPEVWHQETADPKPIEKDIPMGKIDFETGQFGYLQQNEEDTVMEDAPTVPLRSTRARISTGPKGMEPEELPDPDDGLLMGGVHEAVERLGGTEAIAIRQRLIALLARVALALPLRFTRVDELFDVLTEEFMHLPTIFFSILISTSKLPGNFQMAFNADLLIPLISGRLPDFTVTTPEQSLLEGRLLPRRAITQSFAANAKISLVLEQIFMYMMTQDLLKANDSLRKAVENGISERHSVYGTAKKTKSKAYEEEHAKDLMEASSARLLGLLEVLEISNGKPPQPKQRNELLSFTSSISDELSSPPDSDTE